MLASLSSSSNPRTATDEDGIASYGHHLPPRHHQQQEEAQQLQQQPQRELQVQLEQSPKDITVFPAAGNNNQCQISTFLDTSVVSGDRVSSGIMFAVTSTSNDEDIEILSFEINHAAPKLDDGEPVEVYYRQGTNFLNFADNPSAWNTMGKSIAYLIPTGPNNNDDTTTSDNLRYVIPRIDLQPIRLLKGGDSISFYITFTKMILRNSLTEADSDLTTGTPYVYDNYMQLDVGAAFRDYYFPFSSDIDRVFHGIIHYRTITPTNCATNSDIATNYHNVVLLFEAYNLKEDADFRSKIIEAIEAYMIGVVGLRRLKDVHNLNLETVTERNLGECSINSNGSGDNGNGGCSFFEVTTEWSYYESTSSQKVEIELIKAMTDNQGNITSILREAETEDVESPSSSETDSLEVVYVGDQALSGIFELSLVGVPNGTVANPIQRRYISMASTKFLHDYFPTGKETIYDIFVETQTSFASRRRTRKIRHLRDAGGGQNGRHQDGSYGEKEGLLLEEPYKPKQYHKHSSGRKLQNLATLSTQVIVSTIGHPNTTEEFFEAVQGTFAANPREYLAYLRYNHLRPGEINDGQENLGLVFQELIASQIILYNPQNDTGTNIDNAGSRNDDDSGGSTAIWVWIGFFVVASVWVILCLLKDYVFVSRETRMKKKERLLQYEEWLKEEEARERQMEKEEARSVAKKERDAWKEQERRKAEDEEDQADDNDRTSSHKGNEPIETKQGPRQQDSRQRGSRSRSIENEPDKKRGSRSGSGLSKNGMSGEDAGTAALASPKQTAPKPKQAHPGYSPSSPSKKKKKRSSKSGPQTAGSDKSALPAQMPPVSPNRKKKKKAMAPDSPAAAKTKMKERESATPKSPPARNADITSPKQKKKPSSKKMTTKKKKRPSAPNIMEDD